MTQTDYRLALVVPCFNEGTRFDLKYWESLISKYIDVIFIFVDDGSSDSTHIHLSLLKPNTNVDVIRKVENEGKAEAIRSGMKDVVLRYPRMTIVGYLDADGAFSDLDIGNLMEVAKSEVSNSILRDAWISSRVGLAGRSISRRPSRHYLGRLVATFVTMGWKDAPYDTQSGFKLFLNSTYFRQSLENRFMTRWFFDVEILNRIAKSKNGRTDIWEEVLLSWKDVSGSHIRPRQYLYIIRDIWVARRCVKKSFRVLEGAQKWI